MMATCIYHLLTTTNHYIRQKTHIWLACIASMTGTTQMDFQQARHQYPHADQMS